MRTISLQRRQRLIDCITAVDDEKFFSKIEKELKKFMPKVDRLTVDELRNRAIESQNDYEAGSVVSKEDAMKKYGL